MSNTIKYNETKINNTINKGNYYLGVNDVSYGPTETTGFWNGITPPENGYTLYGYKGETSGPSIHVFNNDAELITFVNQIGGSANNIFEAVNYFSSNNDFILTNRNYENIVTDGLVLNLDAGFTGSYPKGGTVWNDLSGDKRIGTLTNGPTFDSGNGGSIVFDGVDDFTNFGNILNLGTNNCTINVWLKINSSWASGTRYFVSKALAAGQNYRYAFGFTSTRQLRTFLQGNGGADIIPITTSTLNLNEWYMCTMVVNRNSSIEIYINGELQTLSGNATISQWNNLNFQSQNPFRVGSYTAANNTTPHILFPGSISIVQMYFRSLTPQEIQQNFNATKSRFGL